MKNNDRTEQRPNVVTLVKDGEKYLFAYDDTSQKALLGVLGSFARNPELNFSWHDAAILSRKIRENETKRLSNARLSELRAG